MRGGGWIFCDLPLRMVLRAAFLQPQCKFILPPKVFALQIMLAPAVQRNAITKRYLAVY